MFLCSANKTNLSIFSFFSSSPKSLLDPAIKLRKSSTIPGSRHACATSTSLDISTASSITCSCTIVPLYEVGLRVAGNVVQIVRSYCVVNSEQPNLPSLQ
eukprot:gb/GEZN01016441.1/.p1 GENE.gb/GEZN01016441.1/~~gb/GEZN01016441.1/.p1  ORF type:complete len:100 (+),score=8.14 gb/GEZN01016441.1/:291-590(+)